MRLKRKSTTESLPATTEEAELEKVGLEDLKDEEEKKEEVPTKVDVDD